jgi:hypothetical protein
VKQIVYPLPDLHGPGGNAFSLLGQASNLMSKHNIPESIRSQFHTEATSGDYEHLLSTLEAWFTVAITVIRYEPLVGRIRDHVSMLADASEDEDLETSMLTAKEQYASFEDPENPEVLDLRGMAPAEAMEKIMAKQREIADKEAEKSGG